MPKQHIHKYRRLDIGRKKEYWVMHCVLPGCTSYTAMKSKVSCPALEGKMALCSECSEPFLLDRRSLSQARPNCSDCVVPKKDKERKEADKFFAELEGELTE